MGESRTSLHRDTSLTKKERDGLNRILKGPSGQTREIFCRESRGFSFSLRNGKPSDVNESISDFGAALRILKNGSMGFSWTADRSEVSRLPDKAEKFSFPVESWGWQIPALNSGGEKDVEIYDDGIFSRSGDSIWEKLLKIEEAAKKKDSRIEKSLDIFYSGISLRTFVANSNGCGKESECFIRCGEKTVFSLAVALIGHNAGEVQLGGSYRTRCFSDDLNDCEIVEEAVDDTVSQFGGVSIDPRKMTVLLSPAAAGVYISLVSSYLCADDYLEGRVPPEWKEGSAVASPLVTIIDDGTIPRLPGSFPFDCEGVPAGRHKVVEKGVFKNFLSDSRTSKLLGRKTTGNAGRSVQTLPHVSFFNLFVENGETPKKELIKSGEIFQIDEIIGEHLVSSESAQFSFGARGRLIKNGAEVKPVRGVTVSGNLINFFKNIIGVGNDLKFFSSIGSPSLLVKDVQISGE